MFGLSRSRKGINLDRDRKTGTRARKQIFNFMHDKCGLMDKNNPCKCEKKTKVLIDVGYVNPKKLLFNVNYVRSVESAAKEKTERLDELMDERSQKLFRENPFQDPPDFRESIREILNHKEFRDIFNFTN